MASDSNSSSTGPVAIVAIFLIVIIAGFVAWRMGMFGGHASGGGDHHSLDIKVNGK